MLIPAFSIAQNRPLTRCDSKVEIEILKSVKGEPPSKSQFLAACTDSKRPYALADQNCAQNIDSCLAPILKARKDLKHWRSPEFVGNPSWHLCYFLKGQPEFTQYRMKNENWVKASLCFFPGHDLFVDLDDLFGTYLRRK
ncbi:MAG: hypothetical protein NDJ90_05155 [Oligoflexia bacterium]|nr:hypothetical protein [Oligoflexia bacterium]